jgi:hypothetical protein
MHYDHQEQLKRLRAIEPDPAFLARSRHAIVGSPARIRIPLFMPLLRIAGAFAVLAAALGASGIFFPAKPVLSSSLNADSLREEIQSTIAIQVQEIQYDQTTGATISNALAEIRDTDTKHLNERILQSEATTLSNEASDENASAEIDALLDQIGK